MNAPPLSSIPGLPDPVGRGAGRRLEASVLSEIHGLRHAFTLRGSEPLAILSDLVGSSLPIHSLQQVHGSTIHVTGHGRAAVGDRREQGDALITDHRGIAIAIRVADCVPILICHERSGAIAAVHAGWRGTVAGVLPAAIRALCETYGADPAELRIAIGPCIGPCCFEVGPDVVELFLTSDPRMGSCIRDDRGTRIDLPAANRFQALWAGVTRAGIEELSGCTMCWGDRFESHRRDGERAGRMLGLIAWKP